MTTPQSPGGPLLHRFVDSYGYLWWLGHVLTSRGKTRWAAGSGLGGQRLYVVPSLDMVVVVTVYTPRMPSPPAGETAPRLAVRAAIDR